MIPHRNPPGTSPRSFAKGKRSEHGSHSPSTPPMQVFPQIANIPRQALGEVSGNAGWVSQSLSKLAIGPSTSAGLPSLTVPNNTGTVRSKMRSSADLDTKKVVPPSSRQRSEHPTNVMQASTPQPLAPAFDLGKVKTGRVGQSRPRAREFTRDPRKKELFSQHLPQLSTDSTDSSVVDRGDNGSSLINTTRDIHRAVDRQSSGNAAGMHASKFPCTEGKEHKAASFQTGAWCSNTSSLPKVDVPRRLLPDKKQQLADQHTVLHQSRQKVKEYNLKMAALREELSNPIQSWQSGRPQRSSEQITEDMQKIEDLIRGKQAAITKAEANIARLTGVHAPASEAPGARPVSASSGVNDPLLRR